MKFKKMSLKVLALVMIVAMLLSIFASTVSAAMPTLLSMSEGGVSGSTSQGNSTSPIYGLDKDGDGEINYVALGDSMTNGFGMGDYYLFMQRHEKEDHANDWSCTVCTAATHHGVAEWEYSCPYSPVCDPCLVPAGDYPYIYDLWANNNWGYLSNASQAYPTLLADMLAESTGKAVNQLNMALSGMRAEELRFMLDNEYATNGYDGYTSRYFIDEKRLQNAYYSVISNPKTYVSPYAAELNAKVNAVQQATGMEYFRQFQIDYPLQD